MRHVKDRRAPRSTALFPFRDNAENPRRERRKNGERRMENLDDEERQLLLSEMPSTTLCKPR